MVSDFAAATAYGPVRSSVRILGSLCLAGVVFASCGQRTAPAAAGERLDDPDTTASAPEFERPRQVPGGASGVRAEMAEELPGFGGFFRDAETGEFVVWIRNPTPDRVDAARELVRSYLGRPDLDVTAREADYDYRQLLAWHREVGRALLGPEGPITTGYGIDERRNRLLVNVADTADVASVRDRLSEVGIPAEAVEVRVTGPAQITPRRPPPDDTARR